MTSPAAAAPNAFQNLPLSPAQHANLEQLGYLEMTPIQAASLPLALAGRDLIAQAQTGSGKTAAFALALLERINPRWFAVQACVLCPTRELADQVTVEIRRLARAADNIKVVTLCGGVPLRTQTASLEHGAHVVVGTPGRIGDHLQRQTLDLTKLNTLVLDEADRMLDMGFFDDIALVAKQTPLERQTLLFSATYPPGIEKLAHQFLRNPATVTVQASTTVPAIEQRFYEVTRPERPMAVAKLLNHFRPASCLAFCNTKAQVNELVTLLQAQGFSALPLHGDLEQRERDQVMALFAGGSCSVLVATDLAARGLDIQELEAVINVEITPDPEVHVHRIGRTGRLNSAKRDGAGLGSGSPAAAGTACSGLALSLATLNDMGRVGNIEQYMKITSVWHKLDELSAAKGPPLQAPNLTLQILGGRKEKIRAGDVLGALTGPEGGTPLTKNQIGKIAVTPFCTFVAVKREAAQAACDKLNTGRIKGKLVRVRLVSMSF